MKHLLLFLAFLGAFTQVHAQKPQTFTPAKPEEAGFDSRRLERLDQLLQGFVNDGIAPHVVTFVARGGKVIHHKAYGYSNLATRTPLKKDDLFRIASQTKALTTVALMILYEEGKCMPEDPISRYLPEFSQMSILDSYNPATGEIKTHPATKAITIRHLLTHTAGIPYEHPLDKLPAYEVPFYNSLQPVLLADVIKKLATRPLLHEPGEAFTYGLNTDILGRLVEVISGKPLDQFIRERVTEPLGMKDTYFYLPAEKSGRLVELYAKVSADSTLRLSDHEGNRSFAVKGAKTYFSGGAGMVGSAEDYARLCQMLLNGGEFNGKRILARKTVDMMLRNQIGELEVWDRNDHFGYGFQIFSEDSHYGDQASPSSAMWGGMYCSEFTIDPKENLILLVFTNVHPYAHYGDFVRKFRVAVYQALL
ncbi:MAG: class A beta-lactamase-related serine hydrolase [Bacteroidetes bacterium]|nr:MAG: class A beta-lactamase-related serine hydrolase [Bacteroidota bacterium]